MGALFALLIPLLPGLIQTIEDIFKTKPKSGPTDKMPALSQAIRDLISHFILSGATLPDGSKPVQPTDEQLLAFLEGQVQTWKQGPAPGATNMWFVQGAVTPLRAA